MAAAPREAASLVYSTDALKHRANKAGLTPEDIAVLLNNNVKQVIQNALVRVLVQLVVTSYN